MIKLKDLISESFQKRHFLNLIKQEIDSLKGQIAYSNDKVNYKGTEDWEKKEFKAVLKDLKKKLKDTEKHYKRVQKLKEGKLTEGKWGLKGNYLTMPGGQISSMPSINEKDKIVVQIKRDEFRLSYSRTQYLAQGPYQKEFKTKNHMVKWLNKEKAKYIGIG